MAWVKLMWNVVSSDKVEARKELNNLTERKKERVCWRLPWIIETIFQTHVVCACA